MNKYKVVFFDLDDTLWDFQSNAKSALMDIYNELPLNRIFQDFESFFGIYEKKNVQLWEMYGKGMIDKPYLMSERFYYPLKKMGVDDLALARKIGDRYLEIIPKKGILVPYAREILDYLSGKYKLSIISNGFVELQYRKLQNAQIEGYFDHVVLSEQAKALKPDRRIFEYAMLLNNARPEECIMVGDSYESDVMGAINAGIDQVYFSKNDSAKELATYQIRSLVEIKDII